MNWTKKEGIRMTHGLMINRLGNLYLRQNNPQNLSLILREQEQFIKAGKRDYRKDPVHSLLFINWENAPLSQRVDFMKTVKEEHIKNGYAQAAALANYHIASLYESADQPEEALKYLYENRDIFISKITPADELSNLQYL